MPTHLENLDLRDVRDGSIVSLHDGQFRKMSVAVPEITMLSEDAAKATRAEHSMTLAQGLRTYPKAVGWSMLLSTAIVMEGFDIILLNNLFAYPPFQKQFGTLQPDGTYQLTAAWQSGLSNGALVGEILGLFVTGIVAERYGYRKTIIGALSLVVAFIFIVFFSKSVVQLLIGEILLGIPWGVFQTITTTYAAEGEPARFLIAYVESILTVYSLSCGLTTLSDDVCKSVLGLRAAHRFRRFERHDCPNRQLGLPHSIRASMVLAYPHHDRRCIGTRVSVVAGPKGTTRRRAKCPAPPYIQQ
jgi:Sugar (and other) transporter